MGGNRPVRARKGTLILLPALLLALAVLLSGCATSPPSQGAGQGAARGQNLIVWPQGFDGEYNLSFFAKGARLAGCGAVSGSLPPWLTLDGDSCVLFGIAPTLDDGTSKKEYPPFSISGSGDGGNITLEVFVTVIPEAPEMIPVESSYCTVGEKCEVEVARAEKGVPPYSFYSDSFAAGAPPMGTAVSSDGKLTGKPSAEGRYRFGVCAADSNKASDCGTTQIVIQKKAEEAKATTTPAGQASRNFTLTVKVAGEGKGDVMSDIGLLLCGQTSVGIASACSASYREGTELTIYATPFEFDGSSFKEWGGDCSGSQDCVLTLDSDKTVTAFFDVGASATVDSASCTFITKSAFKEYDEYIFEVRSSGTVTGPPGSEFKIFTAFDAIQSVPSWTGLPQRGGMKAKRAYTDDPATTGWSGFGQIAWKDADGTGPSSYTDLTGVHVYAEGDAEGYPSVIKMVPVKCVRPDDLAHIIKVNVTRYGDKGRVTSVRSGIDCGKDCAYGFLEGDNITLIATPEAGYSFWGWSGDCEGTGPCLLSGLDVDKYVGATFSDYASAISSSTTTTTPGTITTTVAPSGGGDYGISIGSVECRLVSSADEYGSTRYHRQLTASGTASGPEGAKFVVSVIGHNEPSYPIGLDGDLTMSSSWSQSEGGYGFSSIAGYRNSGHPASTSWSVVETDTSSVCGGSYPPCAPLQMGVRASVYRDGAFPEGLEEKMASCPG